MVSLQKYRFSGQTSLSNMGKTEKRREKCSDFNHFCIESLSCLIAVCTHGTQSERNKHNEKWTLRC